MDCSLSYDLDYVIVENWLLQAGQEAISGEDGAQLEFDFIKMMLVSRTFKHVFLRLFHQNFSFRIKEEVQSLAHFQLFIKDGAPLFRNVQVHSTRIYGVVKSKWVFAMLITNDVVLKWRHQVDYIHFRIKKSAHKFSPPETQLESFMHLMFHDEYNEMNGSEQLVNDANVDHLHCTLNANMVGDGSFPSELVRVFNVDAKKLQLSFVEIGASDSKIDLQCNPLAEIPRYVAERTENLEFELSFCVSEPFNLSLWNSCQWRMVMLYGVQVCPNLNTILLHFDYAVVDISQVEQLYSVMTELIGWLVDEVLPKLPANCHLHIQLFLYIANGIYVVCLQPHSAWLTCSLLSLVQFENFFEILTFLLAWFIDKYLRKMACVYTIVVSVQLHFIGASEDLFTSRLQRFAQDIGLTVEQNSSRLPNISFRTFKEQQLEVNWTMSIQQ